jgi:hypothetical protein
MRQDDGAETAKQKSARRSRGTKVSVDELVAKSRTVLDRVVPIFERAASKIRSRLARK